MALAAVAVHRAGSGWLVLAVVTSLAVPWVLRPTTRPRLAASYSLGWLIVFGIALGGRREGDYVLASDAFGYTLMGVAFALVVVAAATLSGRTAPRT